MRGIWSLQRWHGKVIPLRASSRESIVYHYIHIVLYCNLLSIVTIELSIRKGDNIRGQLYFHL